MQELAITDAQLQAWLQQALWPLARIGGVIMASPLLGEHATPPRVRLMLVLVLALAVVPLLPTPVPIPPFSADWWLRTIQEVLLGLMMGFLLKIIFEAAALAGEVIAGSMGLSFARLADPVRGVDTAMLGQLFSVLFGLLFVTVGGHLRLIELLVHSFQMAPEPGRLLSPAAFRSTADFAAHTFADALRLAMPYLATLLLVNLGFGVMSRSAPSLNAMSVGFPLSLGVGLMLLWAQLPAVEPVFAQALLQAWDGIAALLRG